jgi:hypothetical protein
MHALVGYVELGTDNWIGNITNTVLANETSALLAFLWTNALMFTLRFFAGPIVHKINPVGLLFATAVLGTAGLWMLGQDFTNSTWPWMAAVTVYALGKTFYWPTLLGVISERFPKGGALALGLSGGIGMMAAGLFGAPGIGYKQDYFAVEKLKETAPNTYNRYMARDDDGKASEKGFPLLTDLEPSRFPKIAGLDNSRLKVFDDFNGNLGKVRTAQKDKVTSDKTPRVLASKEFLEGKSEATREYEIKDGDETVKVPVMFVTQDAYDALEKAAKAAGKEPPPLLTTTLQAEMARLAKDKTDGKKVEPKLEENLSKLNAWWEKEGEPGYAADRPPLAAARLYGPKQALLYTAIVPAILSVGFLILILYFAATGGYKQVHLESEKPYRPTGGAPADAWGK